MESAAPSLQSMTGFGTGEAPLGAGVLRVELRSVNARHLDLRVRAPDSLDVVHLIEEQLRARLGRGRVEATVRWEVPHSSGVVLDTQRARQTYSALCALRDELSPGEPVSLRALLQVPGLFSSAVSLQRQEAEEATTLALTRAVSALTQMRLREGNALKEDLLAHAKLLASHRAWIDAERPRMLSAAQERMRTRVAKLLEGSDVAIDEGRLAQEIAWLADRSDVAEEITRLGSHLSELTRTLKARGEMVGRKLDFLVQELGREINTIGSKANDAAIGQRVVEMKAELERIREQVQNIL